jgi:hypothetical protein
VVQGMLCFIAIGGVAQSAGAESKPKPLIKFPICRMQKQSQYALLYETFSQETSSVCAISQLLVVAIIELT